MKEVADRLYTVPPARFVAARDEAVAAARADGDRATAAALAGLRRPTVAAWLVNLLALRRPDLVAGLTDLADGLAEAQRGLRGERLRELAARRRSVVSALVTTARSLAVEVDPAMARAKLPLSEVEGTLNAALSDREVADRVRSGRLLRPVAYAGFGELPRPRLRLVPGVAEGGAESTAPDRAALVEELGRARHAAEAAAADLERALAARRDAEEELAGIDSALAELQARRAAAADEVGRREAGHVAARRAAAAARRRVDELEAVLTPPERP